MKRKLILIVALAAAFVPAAPTSARVPRGFVGMMVDGPLFPRTDRHVNLGAQLDRMVASGVESIRVVFDWTIAQPYPSWSDVPPADRAQFTDAGGIPTRFGPLDQLVALAAQRRLAVLPVVLYTPWWDAARHPSTSFPTPRDPQPYANFLTALIDRYGPHGSFWRDHGPPDPIGAWQVWNEPNIKLYWSLQPFAASYVRLLRAAHAAIKRADPTAQVALAGLPNYSWTDLGKIYRQPGARRLFDVVAIHPFTKLARGVVKILERVRGVMDAAGDRHKPILATEVGWPSSLGHVSNARFGIGTTQAGQAQRLAQLLPLLARKRAALGLIGFDYYTWATPDDQGGPPFDFAGLFRFADGRFTAKPSADAFRRAALALDGCRRKGTVATVCAKRS